MKSIWIEIANSYSDKHSVSHSLKKYQKINQDQYFIEVMQASLPLGEREFRKYFEDDFAMSKKLREYIEPLMTQNHLFIIPMMDNVQIEMAVDALNQRQQQEYDKMLVMFDEAQRSPIFKTMKTEQAQEPNDWGMTYGVVVDIYRIALQIKPPADIHNGDEFIAAWNTLDSQVNSAKDQLNSYVKLLQQETGVQTTTANV